MGYELTQEQIGDILERFYGRETLRRICKKFRKTANQAISPPTILRRILHSVKDVDEALTYLLTRGDPGFRLQLGDKWEIDELYVPLKGRKPSLIIVRDLRTAFVVGFHLASSTTTEAVEVALKMAKAFAHKCPAILRCDGHHAYEAAVKAVFGNMTKLEVHPRVEDKGQNQSIEGFNRFLRERLRCLGSLHSEEKSPIIVKGMIIDYNFVNESPSLIDVTPAIEATVNVEEVKNGWDALLELVRKYMKDRPINMDTNAEEKEQRNKNKKSNMDLFIGQEESSTAKNPEKTKTPEESLATAQPVSQHSYPVHEYPFPALKMLPSPKPLLALDGFTRKDVSPKGLAQLDLVSKKLGNHYLAKKQKNQKQGSNETSVQTTFNNLSRLESKTNGQTTFDTFLGTG